MSHAISARSPKPKISQSVTHNNIKIHDKDLSHGTDNIPWNNSDISHIQIVMQLDLERLEFHCAQENSPNIEMISPTLDVA